ncbi:zinc finger and SCAN domain-containing protein 2-like, partial [Stegastes partitus]|uniref:Zinc finger and SCAN domain-containing protein 2-like n=1 Tax=Stegastes partitus TaxID=144197 RepID=A0A9Y4NVP6_9TELE
MSYKFNQVLPQPLKLPLHDVYQEEEAPADLLRDQERNSGLHQKDPDHLQIKVEQEELCTSPEGELLVQNQESDTFIETPTYKERDHSDTEPDNYQLLCHNFFVDERSDQERSKHADLGQTSNAKLKPTKTHHRNNSHSNNVDNTPMAESPCKTDRGRKSLTCEVCGKAFKNKYYMKKHYISHTDEKPFSCKTCGKNFSQGGDLKVHTRTHTGEKPYVCNTCGKRFSNTSKHKRHTAIHKEEKPYSCGTCGKSFCRQDNLGLHMRTHTGEKPYSCKTCGKSFRQGGT